MSNSESGTSLHLPPEWTLTSSLHIAGYHFQSVVSPTLSHGVTVNVVYGYRISNKTPVMAKVSSSSFQLEREFYVMRKLYNLPDGGSYIVQPIELVHLSNGLSAAIYANEGSTCFLDQRRPSASVHDQGDGGDDGASTTTTSSHSNTVLRTRTYPGNLPIASHSPGDQQQNPVTTAYHDLGAFLRLAIQCTDCLEFIHRNNTVHGEIRLSAFQWKEMDEEAISIKMWNFGSGKSFQSYLTSDGWKKAANNKHVSQMLQRLLVYMSPEQTGRTTHLPDHRTDIYSLGIVFYILLTQQTPFDGAGPLEVINSIVSRKVPLVHDLRWDVPEVLSRIIEKMTSKAPDDRYSSAYGVRADLKECLKRLGTGSSNNEETIPSFSLGQQDVASVFTLPKSIYGRQAVLEQLTQAIDRYVQEYKPMRPAHSSIASSIRSVSGTGNSSGSAHTSSHGSVISDTCSEASSNHLGSSSIQRTLSLHHSGGGLESEECSIYGGTSTSKRRRNATTIVSLYGPGGIGKSTLFIAVQATARKHGYIATIKFDSRNKTPYSGVLRALSQILQQILSESENDIRLFYDNLKAHLGAQFCNIKLLAEFIPELNTLVFDPIHDNNNQAAPSDANSMDNDETQARFHNLFIETLRVITHWKMITLFFDDLHQADDHSIEMISSLIHARVKILMFVNYRDQEVSDKLGEMLEKETSNITFINVDALDMDAMIDFLCDTLHRPREDLVPLAEIILKKTGGNAFYTAQLLRTLERKKLLYFNWERNEWDFNLSKIRDGASYSKHAQSQLDVSFMVARLKELSRGSQQVLKWASFIGDTFSWSTVKHLILNSDDDTSSMGSTESSSAASFEDNASTDLSSTDTVVDTTMRSLGVGSSSSSSSRPTLNPRTSSSQDPLSGLQSVLQEGYIMPLGDDEFKWSHDRITQAAGELASPKSRSKIHLAIAQYMMKEKNTDTFLIADHLLKCRELLDGLEDKKPYQQIMMDAGNKGRSSGAHGMAFQFYDAAIHLGDPATEWEDDDAYSTTLHLYTSALSLSWVVGQYERTEELLDIIFQHARTPLDRMTAYRVQAKYYFSTQMHDKGRETLHRCLEDLGEDTTKFSTITTQQLEQLYFDVEKKMLDMGENVTNIPASQDPMLRAITSIMEELTAIAYWSGEKDEFYYCAIRIVELSLTKGVTPCTGVGCQYSGIGYATLYKKYAFAEEIGAIGLTLLDKHAGPYEKGRAYMMYAVFNIRWKYHHREALKYFEAGINVAYSAGDRIYQSFNQVHRLVVLLGLNRNLADTLHEAERNYEDIHAWSSSVDSNMFAICIIRLCRALAGHTFTDTPHVFDGDDGFNDEHFVKESIKYSSNPELLLGWYDAFKIIPLALYGHVDAAIDLGFKRLESVEGHPCHRHTRIMLHYFSLALACKMRENKDMDPALRRMYYAQIKENQDKVYEWAEHSPDNYMMYWTLIEAEVASLEDNVDIVKTCRLYEDAIDQARQGGWHLAVCIAHEFAGLFYERIGLRNVAYTLIRKAIDLYMTHGAHGKARHVAITKSSILAEFDHYNCQTYDTGVQTDLPYLVDQQQNAMSISSSFEEHQQSMPTTTAANEPYTSESIPPVTTEETLMTLDIVDMASILKSSQVMSSEIKFDRLLSSMQNIIFENAGAESGAIILETNINNEGEGSTAGGYIKQSKFAVCAYRHQKDEDAITYNPPRKLSEAEDLVSSRIINHTIHTRESIFIPDVEQDPRFAVGQWFERAGRKSVICMPIIHKNIIAGCLFIEGSVGSFTQRHITVLGLLCQQMGISVTNAFLFMSVNKVTKDNYRMIENQKRALEEARKSKEAADRATRLREIFLANMSHEIRTPFSGFYGMISLLADTDLTMDQMDLVLTAKQSCENLLGIIDDLLNFSKLQAGKVALDLAPTLVEDMIGDVIEMLIAMAAQKRINVTYTIAHDVPSVILADANRVKQIIINLLGNAIKFTEHGEISIRCTIDRQAASKKKRPSLDMVPLLIEVIDTGIGISEEQRKMLFVPFSQVDGSTTRKYGGTGLGLSICLQLVELMSGRIDVTSTPGKGSNFNFTIQVKRLQEESTRRNNEVAINLDKLHGARIVVADKHVSTVAMVRQLLPGTKVDGVCTIPELQQLMPHHYDAIIIGMSVSQSANHHEWSSHLKYFVNNVKCGTIIMHYPSRQMGMIGFDNTLQPTLSSSTSSSSFMASENAAGSSTVARIAIPLRRRKLLQSMLSLLEPTLQQQSIPVLQWSSSTGTMEAIDQGKITDEEKAVFSTMHILVAEDNPVAQKLLYKQLTRLGFHVECANDGLEAVETWRKHPAGYFQMGFFDHHMPNCDGVQATKTIRAIEADEQRTTLLPIVALTADVQQCAQDTCMRAGMNEYLTKPMNQKSLAAVLRSYCTRH